MNGRAIRFGPWLVGALVWGGLSILIINEHFRVSGGSNWQEMWFICSLLWFQFGFARVIVSLMRREFYLVKDQLLIALIPPVILYIFVDPSIFRRPNTP